MYATLSSISDQKGFFFSIIILTLISTKSFPIPEGIKWVSQIWENSNSKRKLHFGKVENELFSMNIKVKSYAYLLIMAFI